MFGRSAHRYIHTGCLLAAAFFMPVSVWMLSAVSIAGAVNWIAAGGWRAKIQILSKNAGLQLIMALFGMYILWLLNTSDMAGALDELKLKLPLLLIPLVVGTSEIVGGRAVRMTLYAFTAGCLTAALAGFMALAGWLPVEVHDSRDLALFVPTVRLSVMINFAIFSSLWLGGRSRQVSMLLRGGLAGAAAVMTLFLFSMLAVTGIVLFVALLGLSGIWMAFNGEKKRGAVLAVTAAAAATVTLSLVAATWHSLHHPVNPGVNVAADKSPSGNIYKHYPEETLLENGYLVWNNVCEEELRKVWNERSAMAYDGADSAGNELRVTLIRYITYLGMRKDSAAVASLSRADIQNVENGYANRLYSHPANPAAKAYELAWQLDRALKGANPSGHSVTQRVEFYRASLGIIRANLLTGVGTGDTRKAFAEEYARNGTRLSPEYRMRSHNQYLGFAVTFGLPGMIMALALMMIPWLKSPSRSSYLFVVFISAVFISMFNDDTFASFTGTAFFSYFYTLFITFGEQDGN